MGMTIEEAIEILKELWRYATTNKYEIREALDLAIEALEQKSYKSEARRWKRRYLDLKQRIFKLEEQTRWIPVSERLPEEREWYLAVFKEKDTGFQLIPRVADYIGQGENKWRIIDEASIPKGYLDLLECVAWMPLPEPYKAEVAILDKIRAEIIELRSRQNVGVLECLDIIDKYKAESEDKE